MNIRTFREPNNPENETRSYMLTRSSMIRVWFRCVFTRQRRTYAHIYSCICSLWWVITTSTIRVPIYQIWNVYTFRCRCLCRYTFTFRWPKRFAFRYSLLVSSVCTILGNIVCVKKNHCLPRPSNRPSTPHSFSDGQPQWQKQQHGAALSVDPGPQEAPAQGSHRGDPFAADVRPVVASASERTVVAGRLTRPRAAAEVSANCSALDRTDKPSHMSPTYTHDIACHTITRPLLHSLHHLVGNWMRALQILLCWGCVDFDLSVCFLGFHSLRSHRIHHLTYVCGNCARTRYFCIRCVVVDH